MDSTVYITLAVPLSASTLDELHDIVTRAVHREGGGLPYLKYVLYTFYGLEVIDIRCEKEVKNTLTRTVAL